MIEFERYAKTWKWSQMRGRFYAITPQDGDVPEDDYAIIPKKNGKFFVEVRRPGGAKVRMPWREFETVEEAQEWAMRREHGRQRDAANWVSSAIQL